MPKVCGDCMDWFHTEDDDWNVGVCDFPPGIHYNEKRLDTDEACDGYSALASPEEDALSGGDWRERWEM